VPKKEAGTVLQRNLSGDKNTENAHKITNPGSEDQLFQLLMNIKNGLKIFYQIKALNNPSKQLHR